MLIHHIRANTVSQSPDNPLAVMSFGDHLEELRRRLLLAIAGIIPVFFVGMAIGRPLLGMLMVPIRSALRAADQPTALLSTGPFEAFGTYFRVVLVVTIVGSSPWVIYQLWRFVAPGLYHSEKRFAYLLIPMSAVLTAIGLLFLYYVILPVVLTFLVGFGTTIGRLDIETAPLPQGVQLTSIAVLQADPESPAVGQEWINTSLRQLRFCIGLNDENAPIVVGAELSSTAGILQQYRIAEYVKMLLNFALAFGVAFQMPLVVLLLGWAGIVEREWLARYRRHVLAICAVLGAMLTPADPLSMILLAGPLYLLFELGMILLVLLPASRVAGTPAKPDDVHAD
ncbi:MAG: preprotein translocase subunit TatC [Planctomycetota bacterium]|nr:MAG: preprotein translocase subunit TatC [Planctomycetota bacterium]